MKYQIGRLIKSKTNQNLSIPISNNASWSFYKNVLKITSSYSLGNVAIIFRVLDQTKESDLYTVPVYSETTIDYISSIPIFE